MNSINNGGSNSPNGLKLYDAAEDHIFGGMMLEECRDGELYQKWAVDERLDELNARIKLLESSIVEANDWLSSGEGVDLLYYFMDTSGETAEEMEAIKELIEKPNK